MASLSLTRFRAMRSVQAYTPDALQLHVSLCFLIARLLMSGEQSKDDAYIEAAIAEAERSGATIQDVAARMIASQFHGGQSSALYAFRSSGAIDLEPLVNEYCEAYIDEDTTEADKQKRRHLGRYVLEHWRRRPVPGWSELWGQPGHD